MNLTPMVKAQAIAAAIYTTTGIQPEVTYPQGKNPKIAFNQADAEKMRAYVYAMMKKKADIDIDIYSIVRPVIFKDVLPWILFGFFSAGFCGYLLGQAH